MLEEQDEADRWLEDNDTKLELPRDKTGKLSGFSIYVRKEWQTLFGPHWEGYEQSSVQYIRGIYGRHGKAQKAFILLAQGRSSRAVTRETGVAKNTVKRIKDILEAISGKISCPCGGPSGHRGWCSIRFKESPARQEAMRRFHR